MTNSTLDFLERAEDFQHLIMIGMYEAINLCWLTPVNVTGGSYN